MMKKVKFYYDEEEKRHYVTMSVDEFITALLRHLPDKQFKTIRYYGAYYRRKRRFFKRLLGCLVSITQRKLDRFVKNRTVKCPKCGSLMNLVLFSAGKPPPGNRRFGGKITDGTES
jgi:Putative transposase.